MKTFEKLLLALLLFGMAACKIVPVEHPTPKNGEYPLQVAGTEVFNGYNDPRFSPWARIDDPIDGNHIFVLVSNDKRVCVVPPKIWAIAPIGVTVTCAWRMPRSGNRPFRS